jgi:hypothetical protein
VEANEHAPGLIQIAADTLLRTGVKIAETPPDTPSGSTSKPALEFLDAQRKLEPAYAPIKAKFGFSDQQAAQAVAAGTALLIRHCAKFLDPNIAFGIAASGFIEGAKTVAEPATL